MNVKRGRTRESGPPSHSPKVENGTALADAGIMQKSEVAVNAGEWAGPGFVNPPLIFDAEAFHCGKLEA